MRLWLGCWVALFAVWMVLVDSFAAAEVVAGLVSAAIGATGFHIVHSRDDVNLSMRGRQLAIILRRIPRRAVLDCGLVIAALCRRVTGTRLRGRMVNQLFDAGDPRDPQTAARRALVVAGASLAPNTLVVSVEADHLVEHQLVGGRRRSSDRMWPL